MAQRVHVILEDDINGGEATETVTFGLDGVTYEIDLNAANAAKLRDAFAVYVGHGRRVGAAAARGRGRRPASAAADGHSAREVRDWARSNGYTVPDRGRIPAEVREAFAAAH
jgi:hypothetical protein